MKTFTVEIRILGSKARTEIEIVRAATNTHAIRSIQNKYGQVRFVVVKVNMAKF